MRKLHVLPIILCYESNTVHVDLPLAKKDVIQIKNQIHLLSNKKNLVVVLSLVLSLVFTYFLEN
jgi:hypothetical protein